MHHLFSLTVAVLALLVLVEGYGTGAPCGVLADKLLQPQHGPNEAVGDPPYVLRIYGSRDDEANSFRKGINYTVEIEASKQLKGLLLVARGVRDGSLMGEFLKDSNFDNFCLRFLNCSNGVVNGAVTHSTHHCAPRQKCSSTLPCKVRLTWHTSSSLPGPVQFVMTGVMHKTTYWTSVSSSLLMPNEEC